MEKTDEQLIVAIEEIVVRYDIDADSQDASIIRQAVYRLRQQSEDSARNKRNDDEYLYQHHAITESGIGVARLYLQQGSAQLALARLDKTCDEIDAITIKYQPATAQLMGLCDDSQEAIDKARKA